MKITTITILFSYLLMTLSCNKIQNSNNSQGKTINFAEFEESLIVKREGENKKTDTKSSDSNFSSRFKEMFNELESPVIVPSLGYPERFDVDKRVANNLDQRILPKDAYDLTYTDHKNYYDKDKRIFVADHHFEESEKFLINQFSDAIQKGVTWDKNLIHVSDYKGPQNSIQIDNVPQYHQAAVKTSLNYGDLNQPNSKVMKATSDPYNQIFHGKTTTNA